MAIQPEAPMDYLGKVFATIKARHPRAARLLACERGATAVEFAMVALPMFAVLIALLQVGIIFLAQGELETAAEKAKTQLFTGQAQQNGVTQAAFQSTVCSYLPALFTCSGVMVDIQNLGVSNTGGNFGGANTSAPTLTYNSNGSVSNTWGFNVGGANSVLVLRVFYQFPIVSGPLGFALANLPNGTRLLMSTAVFQVQNY
jgi:Flp pilus assembly protein TadG